ncbi:MAG: UDP-N-acetylmuramate--L-alanine ligase, partial [Eudoraea sp.]|nr:UDP-N-acetylmuramate--L-alanine ligase [Eudoraea sp.]
MEIKDIHRVYFIGIGGIGMSALARYFHLTGKGVAGYDKTETPLTREMAESGIPIHYTDRLEDIPAQYIEKSGTLIVYTPAV